MPFVTAAILCFAVGILVRVLTLDIFLAIYIAFCSICLGFRQHDILAPADFIIIVTFILVFFGIK